MNPPLSLSPIALGVLVVLAALGAGAACGPLLTVGRRFDPHVRDQVERGLSYALYPLLVGGMFWLFFRLYSEEYARCLVLLSLLVILGLIYAALKPLRGAWSLPVHAGAALMLVLVLGSELLLLSAAAGTFTARYPRFWVWLAGERAAPAVVGAVRTGDLLTRIDAISLLMTLGPQGQSAATGALRDRSGDVRALAADALAQWANTDAVPALCQAALDPDPQVSLAACRALGRLGDARAAPVLVRALSVDRPPEERDKIREALSKLGPAATKTIGSSIQQASPASRRGMIEAVKTTRDPALATSLLPLLSDPDPEVRRSVIEAVTGVARTIHGPFASRMKMDPSDVARRVTLALRDPQPAVRAAAAAGLGHLVSQRTYGGGPGLDAEPNVPDVDLRPALPVLLRLALSDPDETVRKAAIKAIGSACCAQTVTVYLGWLRDRDRDTHAVARGALSLMEDRAAIPALQQADRDPALAKTDGSGCFICAVLYRQGMGEQVAHAAVIDTFYPEMWVLVHPERATQDLRDHFGPGGYGLRKPLTWHQIGGFAHMMPHVHEHHDHDHNEGGGR
jgi:HEAT repeat protein